MRLKSMASGRAQVELTSIVLLIAFSLTFAGALAQGNITGFFIENETLANISSFVDDLTGNASEATTEEPTDETEIPADNNATSDTGLDSNNTTAQENTTANETSDTGTPDSNDTGSNETSDTGLDSDDTEIPITTTFDIAINVPQKITRGEPISVSAVMTNTGGTTAKGIILSWKLPEGFTLISSNSDCTELQAGQTCSASAEIQTSLAAALGQEKIKAEIAYET